MPPPLPSKAAGAAPLPGRVRESSAATGRYVVTRRSRERGGRERAALASGSQQRHHGPWLEGLAG